MRLIFLLIVISPFSALSQIYTCDFSKYPVDIQTGDLIVGGGEESISSAHSVNSITKVFLEGDSYTFELETLLEDGEFTAYLELKKGDKRLVLVDYWDAQLPPLFFELSFLTASNAGTCYCKKIK